MMNRLSAFPLNLIVHAFWYGTKPAREISHVAVFPDGKNVQAAGFFVPEFFFSFLEKKRHSQTSASEGRKRSGYTLQGGCRNERANPGSFLLPFAFSGIPTNTVSKKTSTVFGKMTPIFLIFTSENPSRETMFI
jgi:hypothetical protein